MATQDTSEETKTDVIDEEVETSHEEDELSTEDDDLETEDTEDTDEDEDSEEDDDESETDEEDEPEFTKRFTQFKGDSYEEYTPELEKAYGNALGEITRLKQSDKDKQSKLDAVMSAAAKDPEFAAKLDELMGDDAKEVTVDPAILKARQDLEEAMDREYKEFVEAHPEMETDPVLQEKVLEEVKALGALSRKKGKILSMKEALRKAWIIVAPEDDGKETVAVKAKEVASKPKTGNKAKKSAKQPKYTEEQLRVAKKWGVELD